MSDEKPTRPSIDKFHGVLSGNPLTRLELALASLFMFAWFVMDADQYLEEKWAKWHPAPVQCELVFPVLPSLPLTQNNNYMLEGDVSRMPILSGPLGVTPN